MSSTGESKGGFLEGLSGIFRGKSTPVATQTPADMDKLNELTSQFNSAVDGLKREIEKRRLEAARQQQAKGGATVAAGLQGGEADREARVREQVATLERAHASMWQSVLKMHAELGTGIGEDEINNLERNLLGVLETTRGIDVDARIRSAIFDRFLLETGRLAWDALQQLMERKQLRWEEPDSRSHRKADDGEGKTQSLRAAEVEEIFLNKTKEQCIPELKGIVSVWKTYPPEDSWLWREVALRAVGAAVRLTLLTEGVNRIKADVARFRAKVEELLQNELKSVHQMMQTGVQSVEEADILLASTDKVIREVVPEIAWEWVESAVIEYAAKLVKQ